VKVLDRAFTTEAPSPCSNLAKVLSAGAVLLTLFTAGSAQQTQNQSTRSILVNVLDRQGIAIRDLAKEDFRIQINGRATAVRNAQCNSGPVGW
jgi:hypothetical protein